MRISDWSSDVCSSDLRTAPFFLTPRGGMGALAGAVAGDAETRGLTVVPARAVGLERDGAAWRVPLSAGQALRGDAVVLRSEERRGRTECFSTIRSRSSPHPYKNT